MTGPRIRIKEAIVVVCRILRTPMPEETPAPHRAFPDKRAARRSGTQGKRTDAGTSSHGRGAHLWIPAPGSRICTAFGGLSGKVGKWRSCPQTQTCINPSSEIGRAHV